MSILGVQGMGALFELPTETSHKERLQHGETKQLGNAHGLEG